jgi:hypothetical protein
MRRCSSSFASWRGRQSIGHEVDADVGVASLGPGARVFGAVHVAQQAIFCRCWRLALWPIVLGMPIKIVEGSLHHALDFNETCLSNQCTVIIVAAENWAATEAWWPRWSQLRIG